MNNFANMKDENGCRTIYSMFIENETDSMRKASFVLMNKATKQSISFVKVESSKVVTHARLGLEGKPNSVGKGVVVVGGGLNR